MDCDYDSEKKRMELAIDKYEYSLRQLINTSRPFTSGDVVDETCGTVPLMEDLEDAIKYAEGVLDAEA